MNNYVDKIMTNHVFDSVDSEDIYYLYQEHNTSKKTSDRIIDQYGGVSDKPTGGFPPIFIDDIRKQEIKKTKERQLASKKNIISIKDILRNKK